MQAHADRVARQPLGLAHPADHTGPAFEAQVEVEVAHDRVRLERQVLLRLDAQAILVALESAEERAVPFVARAGGDEGLVDGGRRPRVGDLALQSDV
jgi:hypothetical protein